VNQPKSYRDLLRECDRAYTAMRKAVDELNAYTTYGVRKEHTDALEGHLDATAATLDKLLELSD
jgi:hypothetical protein